MKRYPRSDEWLNAFVDNEFPAKERAKILKQIHMDAEKKSTACALSHLKDQVKTAYQDIPPHQSFQPRKKFHIWQAVAASVLMLFVLGGAYLGVDSITQQRMVILDPTGSGQQLATQNENEMRIVFHVSQTSRLKGTELLDDIEHLLLQYQQGGKRIRVEVVAHAQGLDLLRQSLSVDKERITAMSIKYPDLTFVACLNTIERLKREQGIDVVLIDEVLSARSGVAHVVKRQQQGWIYIQV
ncbi:MAG: Unknown protein [uncultured Thiotrichaceae bacterium]|uniref:Uncharacterized protein n=1 Tax=uncultured Thiotrichaceae bacterium TaxID=298394 RepID=A0A6S6TUW5_9GAMM|nr:MAG: Unknown protein [uncultured Thiotrichaceae bacterium]